MPYFLGLAFTLALLSSIGIGSERIANAEGTFIAAANCVDIVHDPNRSLLYITSAGEVLRYDLNAQRFLTSFQLGGNLKGIDLSPDANTLAVADYSASNSQNWIFLINLQTGISQKITFPLGLSGEGGTFSVAYGNDGNILVTSTYNGSGWVPFRKYNTTVGTTTIIESLITQDTMLCASADGSIIGFAESNISDGRWGRYRVSDGDLVERTGYTDGTSWFNYEIGTSHDGTQFSIPTYGGTFIYDSSFTKVATIGQYAGPQPIGVVYHPTKNIVYFPWTETTEVRAYDTTTFTQVEAYDFENNFQNNGNWAFQQGRMKISRDGSLLFATVDGGVRYVNLNAVDGACGMSNGGSFNAAPTANFCSVGTVSAFSGTGPWTWTCTGRDGGSAASCSANIQTFTVTPSAGAGGSLSPNTPQTVNINGTASFTVTPNTGYFIASVNGCGGWLSGNTYTTGAITGSCEVSAAFTPTYSISGTVSTSTGAAISGVTMTLSGSKTGTSTTNSNGSYSFTGLSDGTYTIAPSLTGFAFSPSSLSVIGANLTGQNFTGTLTVTPGDCTYSISPSSSSAAFIAAGGSGTITLTPSSSTCNQEWIATSGSAWLTFAYSCSTGICYSSTIQGIGSGTINYKVAASTDSTNRAGNVNISVLTTPFVITEGAANACTSCNVSFNDVTTSDIFRDYIQSIACAGITQGCGSGNYCPTAYVIRGQMAAFIVRAREGEPPADYCSTGSGFNDVSPGDGECKYIKRLGDLQITTGCGNGNYCPDQYVTRGQMAAFLIRALYGENFGYTPTPYFSDVPSSNAFFKYVQRLKDDGITVATGSYNIDDNVTRDQMAAFLFRAFMSSSCPITACTTAAVSVTVTDSVTGKPVQDATVTADTQTATTNATGSATFTGLSSNENQTTLLTISISATGYAAQSTTALLSCGATAAATVSLVPESGANPVSGTISTSNGAAISGVTVPLSGASTGTATTDSSVTGVTGSYAIY